MAKAKAKKIETFRDKYFTAIVYEYRGCRYEVTYANSWQVCCTPAWVQHRDEQAKIDKFLDNPYRKAGISEISGEPLKTAQECLDELWEMMGW